MARAFFVAVLRIATLVLCAAPVSYGAQSKVSKTALRPRLSPAQRLEKLAPAVRRDNPILPAVMYAFERYVQGAPEDTEIDRVVRRALQKHPKLGKAMVQTAVENWKTIPVATKQRLVPAELLNLSSTQALDATRLRAALRGIAPRTMTVKSAGGGVTPGFEPSAITRTLPSIVTIYGVATGKTDSGETPRIIPGKGMTLDTRNVPADASKVKVHFLGADPEKKQAIATATPSKATLSATGITTLLVTVPANLAYGEYPVQVEVNGLGKSNEKWVSYPVPDLKLTPKITSVTPNAQYPFTNAVFLNQAGWPVITGALFTKALKGVVFEPLAQEGLGSYRTYGQVLFVSTTQLKMEVPRTILPGKYRIALWSHGKPISNWMNFTVRAPVYRVKFTTIRCGDESDPETNSDSIRTIWAIGADPGYLWIKMAAGYNDFGDGVSKYYKPEHQWVYLPDGQKGEVRRYLYVVTSVWEWDSGEDWDERINAMAGVASDVAKEIGGFGYVSYGELAQFVVEALEELVILFHGEPNFIGGYGDEVPKLALTADVLQEVTAGVPAMEGTLNFQGNDDTGSYQLAYKIFREQP